MCNGIFEWKCCKNKMRRKEKNQEILLEKEDLKNENILINMFYRN